jgi:hypothetical protein
MYLFVFICLCLKFLLIFFRPNGVIAEELVPPTWFQIWIEESEKRRMEDKAESEKRRMEDKADSDKRRMEDKADSDKRRMEDKADSDKRRMEDKADFNELLTKMFSLIKSR